VNIILPVEGKSIVGHME